MLGYEERSLAHLLSRLCGVNTDKQHQRADWRVRSACTLKKQHASCLPNVD